MYRSLFDSFLILDCITTSLMVTFTVFMIVRIRYGFSSTSISSDSSTAAETLNFQKMVLSVALIFFFCIAYPFGEKLYLQFVSHSDLSEETRWAMRITSHFFLTLNISVNCILYVCVSKSFRQDLRDAFEFGWFHLRRFRSQKRLAPMHSVL